MNIQQKWYYIQLGGHTHVRVFMNGAKCGDLCFRNEEFDAIFNDTLLLKADAIDFVKDTYAGHTTRSEPDTEQARLVELCAELLGALKEAQSLLLHNQIDTGALPGVSQRIRLAIANAELRESPQPKSASPFSEIANIIASSYREGQQIEREVRHE